jgi:hypothetical protein
MRAAAFHESVSTGRLEEVFRSPLNQVFATTAVLECSGCRARFAVFLQIADDPDNEAYLQVINRRIAEDCKDGKHTREIRIA